jgi:hypothetical protein
MSSGRISLLAGAIAAGFVLTGAASCSSSTDGAPPADGGESGGGGGANPSGGGANSSGGGASPGGTPGSGGKGSGGKGSGGAPGSGGSAGGVVCGGDTCTTTAGTGVEAYPCCTKDDTCGVKLPLSVACLPRNQFGTVNDDCETYEIPNLITMPGCCGSDGCGARATFENLGCISNANLGKPKVPCNQSGAPVDGG